MAETITGSDFVHVFRFEKEYKAPNTSGGNDEATAPFVNTRGLFVKKSGRRDFQEGYDQISNRYDLYCYWRNDLEAFVNKDTRVIYDNRDYTIISFERIGERRQYMHFKLAEFH